MHINNANTVNRKYKYDKTKEPYGLLAASNGHSSIVWTKVHSTVLCQRIPRYCQHFHPYNYATCKEMTVKLLDFFW